MRIKNSILTIILLLTLILSASFALAIPYFSGVVLYTNAYDYAPANSSLISDFFVFDSSTVTNVSCHLNGQVFLPWSTGVNTYRCNLTVPAVAGNYAVIFNATNNLNQTNTTSKNFTSLPSTNGSLTISPSSLILTNMTQSPETLFFNATLSNTGLTPMYNPSIYIATFSGGFANSSNLTQNCAQINPGQNCTKTFDVNVYGGTSPAVYNVYFDATWTNSNPSVADNVPSMAIPVRVVYNPELVAAQEINLTAMPASSSQVGTTINSLGNVPLSNINITLDSSTAASWVTIAPNYIPQVNISQNASYTINVTPPAGTAVGVYPVIINLTSNDITKQTVLNINVPQYFGWNFNISPTIAYNKLLTSGTITRLTINNTGNVPQTFQVSYTGSLFSNGFLTNPVPNQIVVQPGTSYPLDINYNNQISLDGNYSLWVNVFNVNASGQNGYLANLIAESTPPTVSLVSPANNSVISGLVPIRVNATDALSGMEKVTFLIDNVLFNTTDTDTSDSTFNFTWNTESAFDKVIMIRAIAYDKSGNSVTTTWYANNQNLQSNFEPWCYSLIPDMSILEDNSTQINLSDHFLDNDYGDVLNYTFTGNENITASVYGGFAYFTPNPNFYGTRLINITAADNASASDSCTFTLTVNNTQDVPTIPFIDAPLNGATVTSPGAVTFRWTASAHPDPEPLAYKLYLGTTTNPHLYTTTNNTQFTTTLQNGTYYWYLSVDDTITTVRTGNYSFQLIINTVPQVINYTPVASSVKVIKNNSRNFEVLVQDPENDALTHLWQLNGTSVSSASSYVFNSATYAVGQYLLNYTATDPNQNSVSRSWLIEVDNQNKAPQFSGYISYVEMWEDETESREINLNNYFSDEDNDALTFSAESVDGLSISFNNGLARVISHSGFFGVRGIVFTASDGENSTSSNIVLVVVNKDTQAPQITTFTPINTNLKIAKNQEIGFEITAQDSETDPISFGWFVNGELKQGGINSINGYFNLREYPVYFLSGDQFDGKVVIGETSTTKETSAVNLILRSLQDAGIEVKNSFTPHEINGHENILLVGTPCSNSKIAELYGVNQNTCSTVFAPGEAQIRNFFKTYSYESGYSGQLALVVTGYSDEEVYQAAKILADFDWVDYHYLTSDSVSLLYDAPQHVVIITKTGSFNPSDSFNFSFDQGGVYTVTAQAFNEDGDSPSEVASQIWNIEVLDRPVASAFDGQTTNFAALSDEQLSQVDLVLEKTAYGKIKFEQTVDMQEIIDLDSYVIIAPNLVAIDTDNLPSFSTEPATITLYNVNFKNPALYYTKYFTSNPSGADNLCSPPMCRIIEFSDNKLVFHVHGFSTYVVKEAPAAGLSLPESIQLGADNEERNKNVTVLFTIANPGVNESMDNIFIRSTAAAKYNVQFYDGITRSSELTIVSLPPGASRNLELTVTVPKNEDGGRHAIGQILANSSHYTALSTLYIYPITYLEVVSVKVDGDSVSDSGSADIKPDTTIDVEVKIKNTGAADFEDVSILGTIYDLDDDDLEDEIDEFKLKSGKETTKTLSFTIPEELDEDSYDFKIEIEAEDEDGITYTKTLSYTLNTKKEKHQLKLDASLSASSVECVRQSTIYATIKNLGASDEDNVKLEIINSDLGANFVKDEIEIDESDDYKTSFMIDLDKIEAGTYSLPVNVYLGSRQVDTQTLSLEVKACQSTAELKKSMMQTIQQKHQQLIAQALASQPQSLTTVKKSSSGQEVLIMALIISSILTVGAIVFIVGALIIKAKKK